MIRPVLLAASGLFLASTAGASRAADGGDDPAGKLSLEARVVGIDGEPVQTSSIGFWRLVPAASGAVMRPSSGANRGRGPSGE